MTVLIIIVCIIVMAGLLIGIFFLLTVNSIGKNYDKFFPGFKEEMEERVKKGKK